MVMISFIFWVFFLIIYVIPSIVAIKKDHPQRTPIILVNILGGFVFGIGWLIALVWCFIEPDNRSGKQVNSADELKKLYELLESGIITQAEFDEQKVKLLR